MAYWNTPHGTSKYSTFYLLHGREMVLPSLQSLRAKLSPEVRDTNQAPRLENLKSNLRTAYKMARDHARKSHAYNKRYYDSAKDREFSVGDYVNFYNPAVKAGVSVKFRRPWIGPRRVTVRKSWLNYEIMNQQGKRIVVHVNRLKRAYQPLEWQGPKKGKAVEKVRPKRRQPEEEEEQEVSSPGPILSRSPLVENRQPEPPSPVRDRQVLDTPNLGPSPQEAPSNHRVDPTYAPSDTPRSRRELGATRETPPLTKLLSRMQTLQEASENEPQI